MSNIYAASETSEKVRKFVASKTADRDTELVSAGYELFPETGKIEIVMPVGISKACAGFTANCALQDAKKEMARLRLKQKLEARSKK
jgi:hypothetical protein